MHIPTLTTILTTLHCLTHDLAWFLHSPSSSTHIVQSCPNRGNSVIPILSHACLHRAQDLARAQHTRSMRLYWTRVEGNMQGRRQTELISAIRLGQERESEEWVENLVGAGKEGVEVLRAMGVDMDMLATDPPGPKVKSFTTHTMTHTTIITKAKFPNIPMSPYHSRDSSSNTVTNVYYLPRTFTNAASPLFLAFTAANANAKSGLSTCHWKELQEDDWEGLKKPVRDPYLWERDRWGWMWVFVALGVVGVVEFVLYAGTRIWGWYNGGQM